MQIKDYRKGRFHTARVELKDGQVFPEVVVDLDTAGWLVFEHTKGTEHFTHAYPIDDVKAVRNLGKYSAPAGSRPSMTVI